MITDRVTERPQEQSRRVVPHVAIERSAVTWPVNETVCLSVCPLGVVDLHVIGDINGEYIIDTNSCQAVDYDGAIWAQTFLRNSAEMLADSKFIKEVIGKEVDERGSCLRACASLSHLSDRSLEFELYTRVEQNRTLVHTQARAILSFIKGDCARARSHQVTTSCALLDWINGSNDAHSYSCVMSCASSSVGLTETNDDDDDAQGEKTIVCSIPVLLKGQDEILPLDFNLTSDNRTALTRILKVSLRLPIPIRTIQSIDLLPLSLSLSSRTCKSNTN